MSPVRMSRVESDVRLIMAFNKALNRHDIAGMMALVREDCVVESSEPAPDVMVYTQWIYVKGPWGYEVPA